MPATSKPDSTVTVVHKDSVLWQYLSEEIKGLIIDGEVLLTHAQHDHDKLSDFSYLVFPFSKAYEGFLKKLFLDLDLIREDDYYSDDIRIGRILNPLFLKHEDNVFSKLCDRIEDEKKGSAISRRLWEVWKKGRNQVFHYFPHNFRRLSYNEALEIIRELAGAMAKVVGACNFESSVTSLKKNSVVSIV